MRKISCLLAASMLAAPLVSQSDTPKCAETASEIANAIFMGADLRDREDMPPLSDLEYSELSKLAGCGRALQPGGEKQLVIIDWYCDQDDDQKGLARSTVMLFDREGVLYGFAVNPVISRFAPTEAAMAADELPSRYGFASSFAEAVTSGGDPTLGGMLELDQFERARLAEFSDSKPRAWRRPDGDRWRVSFSRWDGDNLERLMALIYFDLADRPTGLIFAPTYDPEWVSPNASSLVDRGASLSSRPNAVRIPQPRCSIC